MLWPAAVLLLGLAVFEATRATKGEISMRTSQNMIVTKNNETGWAFDPWRAELIGGVVSVLAGSGALFVFSRLGDLRLDNVD